MWLVYPVTGADVRNARRGAAVLVAASALWYVSVAAVLAAWPDPVLRKVQGKFGWLGAEGSRDWTPFLVLFAAFVGSALLRLLGYRLCRNVAAAVGAVDGMLVANLGAGLYLAAVGTVYFGFTGLIAIVAALGTALEMRFLRFPVMLFGMVVSPGSVRRLSWFFYLRSAWLGLVVACGLLLLAAHIANDLPRPEGSPTDQIIRRANAVLHPAFNGLAGAAVVALPLLTAWYWLILSGIRNTVGRLLDPTGPVVPPEPPVKAGFDQLKHVIHNPLP